MEYINLVYHDENVYLYNNNFLTIDMNDWIGRINLIVTSPPYNIKKSPCYCCVYLIDLICYIH